MKVNIPTESEFTKLIQDARKNFHDLFKKSWDEGQNNLKIYPKKDLRHDLFVVFSELNLWLLIQFDLFLEMLNPRDSRISKYMNLNPTSRLVYLNEHDTINKNSYITNAMFMIEESIKNLMRGLSKLPKGTFFEFTKDFLKLFGMYDPQKHKIINGPYQLRNALHNNGYAYHDFEITLRSSTYKFVKGKIVDFADWYAIHIFFDELLDVLIDVIKSPELQKVKFIQTTNITES